MLQAYVDDSEQRYSRNIFLAGYVSSADKWLRFSDDWDAELKNNPGIEYFKCSEWKAKKKQFRDFGKLDREIKISRLCDVIDDHALWSFQVSVCEKVVNQVFSHRVPYGIRKPHLLLFMGIVLGLAEYQLELGDGTPIDIVFDEQNQIQRFVSATYGGFKDSQSEAFREVMSAQPRFGSDRDFLPLQAADLLAWHAQKFTVGGELRPKGVIAERVLKVGKHFCRHINRSEMERMNLELLALPGAGKLSKKNTWQKVIREIERSIGGGLKPF